MLLRTMVRVKRNTPDATIPARIGEMNQDAMIFPIPFQPQTTELNPNTMLSGNKPAIPAPHTAPTME